MWYIGHYGVGHLNGGHSGRYKWGSGERPNQRHGGKYIQVNDNRSYDKKKLGNRKYNKEHFDEVLKSDKVILSTLSYDVNRTKNTDMFFAAHDFFDKQQYKALFNKKLPQDIYDDDGKKIGTGQFYKYQINNKLNSDMKIASEDSGAKMFAELYSQNKDFYNFVKDKDRLGSYFNDSVHYKFKGYREAEKTLNKIQDPNYIPTSNELKEVYRLFNYTIPYDGAGNSKNGADMARQRAKFFNVAKSNGYGALLDTNDAIYGGFKAKSPVIVFDMNNIVPDNIKQTTLEDKAIADLALIYRKALKI